MFRAWRLAVAAKPQKYHDRGPPMCTNVISISPHSPAMRCKQQSSIICIAKHIYIYILSFSFGSLLHVIYEHIERERESVAILAQDRGSSGLG